MFILTNGGTNIYLQQNISTQCGELDISRKRASLESYAAYTPINVMRVELFFSDIPPIGIRDIPFYRMIDMDEAKFCLDGIESKYGRALTCVRVIDTTHHKRGNRGITLILAIKTGNPNLPPHIYGSIQNPRKWWQLTCANVD